MRRSKTSPRCRRKTSGSPEPYVCCTLIASFVALQAQTVTPSLRSPPTPAVIARTAGVPDAGAGHEPTRKLRRYLVGASY